ncbi:uncharacterized protein LOC125204671 [Salvia hispanica]|uniref:uncharacterized protein LOC125204671 n=1 Tax=Salvia hispanica TaxID=49212 RepID=UPI002009821C|nr:uncharacterized protein LOC125204671 [Salvia hispanica]XP_047959336.1 uncharacterized protein LOC125204671 [Salvia hispanica]
MTTTALPNSMVLNVPTAATNPYVYSKDDGSVGNGGDSVFNPVVKIAVEQATVDSKYVHLRFTYTNKYWQKNANDNSIVAVSNTPVEDTADPSCTLFEASLQSDGVVSLTHVQTGWAVLINKSTNTLYVDENGDATSLGFVDGDALVQLPTFIALKGDNGMYLKAFDSYGWRLQFGSDDANDKLSAHTVTLMPDGHVQILSDHFNKFWWMAANDSDWIYSDWNADPGSQYTTVFWPVKIDENTIALQSKVNNNYCLRYTDAHVSDCLAARADSLQTSARLQVQELVMERSIYNVTYQMENARIYGETPFLAGTATLTNTTDQEDSMAVEITYQDEKSYSFSRGASLKAGVDVNIKAGLPFIFDEKIDISVEISGSFDWDTTTTTATSVTAQGSVPVPPNSTVTVSYVGTKGTCNLPYTYTQEDRSSVTGEITYYNQTDGIYEGVSYYNFVFQVTPA